MSDSIDVVGGGLAGAEAAYSLLKNGRNVRLFEMRPQKTTPAHRGGALAELVCSNSLKSELKDTASGLLKAELDTLGSLVLSAARASRVPAGGALGVDREKFSAFIERELEAFDGFERISAEVDKIDTDRFTLIAAGPLCTDALAAEIQRLTGGGTLRFFDAVAPIIAADGIDFDKAYFASRYGKGDAFDYLNCALDKAGYDAFYDALVSAQTATLRDFEKGDVFEGCMPVEVMAKRGRDALRFGPMKPVGLDTPDGKKAYAVVQLRRENRDGTAYNMVGFQTNLKFGEQKRVFSMIPGLENAEFLRYGVMHRNTYLDAPAILDAGFGAKAFEKLFFAGQITGVEGYVESAAAGLLAALNVMSRQEGGGAVIAPETTICGALQRHLNAAGNYEPMNANFGILPPIDGKKDKKSRKKEYFERGLRDIKSFKETLKWK